MMNRAIASAFAMVSFMALATTATAAVLEVPGDYPDIPTALAVAQSGDTVLVAPGQYHHSAWVSIPAGVTLQSSEGRDATTIFIEDNWGVDLASTETGPVTTCVGFRIWVADFSAFTVAQSGESSDCPRLQADQVWKPNGECRCIRGHGRRVRHPGVPD